MRVPAERKTSMAPDGAVGNLIKRLILTIYGAETEILVYPLCLFSVACWSLLHVFYKVIPMKTLNDD